MPNSPNERVGTEHCVLHVKLSIEIVWCAISETIIRTHDTLSHRTYTVCRVGNRTAPVLRVIDDGLDRVSCVCADTFVCARRASAPADTLLSSSSCSNSSGTSPLPRSYSTVTHTHTVRLVQPALTLIMMKWSFNISPSSSTQLSTYPLLLLSRRYLRLVFLHELLHLVGEIVFAPFLRLSARVLYIALCLS